MENKYFFFGLTVFGVVAYMNKSKLMDMAAKLDSKWTRLHPDVKQKSIKVLEDINLFLKDTPYTVHIFDGWRPLVTQQQNIEKGVSFITDPNRSYHRWGLGVDFVFKDAAGNWTWEPGKDCSWYELGCESTDWYWENLGRIIKENGFEWGGDWKSFDGAHAQLTTLGRTSDLIAKYGEPKNFTGYA